ncbi:MAG: alpha-2-macroglobulin family protein [Myxococcota bacterium]
MRAAALAIGLLACNGVKEPGNGGLPESSPARTSAQAPVVEDALGKTGLKIVMREAREEGDPGYERPTAADATVLSEADTERLLARTERLEIQDGDRQVFAKRADSMKPPITGETVQVAFPPPEAPRPPEVPEGPLSVLRWSPEGDVPLAPSVAVTFDRPMVAVTSQEVAAETVPVTLTPQPDGRWRWLGTKTLVFDPDVRMPMATEYTVTVPAGTRSATGDELKDAKSWKFATPPLQLVLQAPQHDQVGLTPVITLGFDQAIDAKALLPHIVLEGGNKTWPFHLATEAELKGAEDVPVVWSRSEAPEDRELHLVPDEPLPKATRFQVRVKAGAPSAEGPLPSKSEQSFGFTTYSPLRVERHECGWQNNCTPDMPWIIQFNNQLDTQSVKSSAIGIDPSVQLDVSASWNSVTLMGDKPGSTTYTVTLPADITDRFGQKLGDTKPLTFKVGKADPTFWMPNGAVTLLDPDAKSPALSVYSRNQPAVRVVVNRVSPSDWPAYLKWRQDHDRNIGNDEPPGERIADERIAITAADDTRVETPIPLDRWLKGGLGHLVVWVRGTKKANQWDRPEGITWVQGTHLAVDATSDHAELLAFASDLSTGRAIDGAEVRVVPDAPNGAMSGTSDAGGLARIPMRSYTDAPQILTVRKGDDVAFLPGNVWYWNSGATWYENTLTASPRWFTFDDRGLYKPGETVRIKGFVRKYVPGPKGDIERSDMVGKRVRWKATGPRGNDIGSGEVEVSGHGGFDFQIALPDSVNLGSAWVNISSPEGYSTSHSFQIQEFRRPEFEVSANIPPGPHVLGERTTASITASYFAGGGLPGAETQWYASASQASYVPPNQSDFSFGAYNPWWWGGWWSPVEPGGEAFEAPSLSAKTDATGTSEVELYFAAMDPPRPMSVSVSATVYDVNRQAWTSNASTLVHPANRYVGLRAVRSFVKEGEALEIEGVLTDIEGTRVANEPITMVIARESWKWDDGRYQKVREDEQTCTEKSAVDPVKCTFQPSAGGSYVLEARVTDSDGRPNTSELRLWVSGGDATPSRSVELERVLVVPDADTYAPGDTAQLFVKAPFAPSDAVVTWRREGFVKSEHLHLDEATTTLSVPIEDGHTPNLHVQVELTGQTDRLDDKGEPTGAKRPAFASGAIDLPVPPAHRGLEVAVEPATSALMPGDSTTVSVKVTDADGKAVRDAEVVVVVVDESVLALTGYTLADPLEAFYARRTPGVTDNRIRSHLMLANPDSVPAEADGAPGSGGLGAIGYGRGGGGIAEKSKRSGVMSAAAAPMAAPPMEPLMKDAAFALDDDEVSGNASPTTAIRVRTDFSALALFAPSETTDASGVTTVELKVPDNLTRYRVMAVAVDESRKFGKGESTITARNPIMLRPSAPRFLNFGDRFELPFVVQNQTDAPLKVDIAVEATNAAFLKSLDEVGDPYEIGTNTAGRRLTVPANDRLEVRIPAAADMAGTARFQAAVSAGTFSDAARFDLPVWTPATSEAFATYGVIDDGAIVQPVSAPGDVWTQFGGLEITTSSTALQALTDAMLYIVGYPHDCSEQLSSRVMSIAALRDVLTAFDAEGLPTAAEMEAAVNRDLALLAKLQNGDGGFAFWRRNDPSWPYLSIHVAHSLARAEQKGFEVPSGMRDRSLRYLRQIESHIPHWYSLEYKRTLIAYALYVRELMGDADGERARRLYSSAGNEGIPMEALGWLLPTLHDAKATKERDAILAFLNNRVTETAAGANFVTGIDDGARHVLLASDRRVDGVLLDALIRVDSKSDLIPKLVQGLLAHRKRGRWGNTQENAFVLLAMDRYFRTYEGTTPDFVARAWLGDQYAGEQAFKGRETKRARIDIPMGYVTEKPSQDLVLQKDGAGRMYYRIGLRYAPRDLTLEPADYGFAVQRTYEPVDDPADVTRDADGTWHVKAGARVRVRLSMVAESRRYHVALVDPLPAGFEAVNPALVGSGPIPADDGAGAGAKGLRAGWWWTRTWYEHQNMRDERVEAFASLLWDGVHEYTYIARATTPGRFVAPPTKAEEMYTPETFGRSGTDNVIVE